MKIEIRNWIIRIPLYKATWISPVADGPYWVSIYHHLRGEKV